MSDAVTVSPLRQRMIEDMTIRRFGEHTQRDYVRQVREFTAFLGLPPDRAEPEDLRRYQLHLASLGASYSRGPESSAAANVDVAVFQRRSLNLSKLLYKPFNLKGYLRS